jgi:uncharacterized protein (TIGR02147 family)
VPIHLASRAACLKIGFVKSNRGQQLSRAASPASFRLVLASELARRCTNNPRYSLRAFAKYLDVDHASLSQLLRGKRRFTARSIRKFGVRLGLEPGAIDRWIAREESLARAGDDEVVVLQVRELADATASLIADWHHYAILELLRLRDFRPDSRWVARVLGISVDEVNIAVQRLLRLGFLEMQAPDRWVDLSGDTTTSLTGFAESAVERLLEQVRRLMLRAVRALPEGTYEYSATTLAIDTARIPGAIEIISRMRNELLAFLNQGAVRDDVYQLEVSFVPITQLQSKETEHGPTGDALADRDQES